MNTEDRQTMIMQGQAQGEITEKKSRFIASVFEIHSEADALSILESVRKKYYDARHNCYAYILGERQEIQRFSDDKEPQGTAGKPILEVLTKQRFSNTLIIVTRYFGGILLGTGGLVRAYTAAAIEGLRAAMESQNACPVFPGIPLKITCDYSLSGKVQYLISQMEIPSGETLYHENVTFQVLASSADADLLEHKITEATGASAVIERGECASYILTGQGPVPYHW